MKKTSGDFLKQKVLQNFVIYMRGKISRPLSPDKITNHPNCKTTMVKAEVGTPKYIANKMKSKGLQKLKWYCQICEKQCRDENGFKCHTQGESHLRRMLVASEDTRGKIEEYSRDFQKDFIRLLRSSHQEKLINVNRFYQEYIANKEHIHMNATKWTALSQFSKHLGEQGICRVEESEKEGLCIAWIDNSPRALEMKRALKRQQDSDANESIQHQLLQKQVAQAKRTKKQTAMPKTSTPSLTGAVKFNLKNSSVTKEEPSKKNVFSSIRKKEKPATKSSSKSTLNRIMKLETR